MQFCSIFSEAICAIATPSGRGGVGIVRLSGSDITSIIKKIVGILPKPRVATYCYFKDTAGEIIDEGICLYFTGPHSFTGEDVCEFQAHGAPVVLDTLLKTMVSLGARLALPGEFTKRAFLNNKIDLVQAESIADLINAGSQQAMRSALKSLQGEFSKRIHDILNDLIELRMLVEAMIDFPEEEIDEIYKQELEQRLTKLIMQIDCLTSRAKQGVLLQEGITIVLAGQPNVGKSSLLNCLSGQDTAIVTEIPGTTRDILREYIHLDGLPVHIVDTAGLRDTQDLIEQEGMRRTRQAIQQADMVWLLVDASQFDQSDSFDQHRLLKELNLEIPVEIPVLIVRNKMDLIRSDIVMSESNHKFIDISAKYGQGIDLLIKCLKKNVGYEQQTEGIFMARRRHLTAIHHTYEHLLAGHQQIKQMAATAYELLAEELMRAQRALAEITGEFSADDLLGKIFSNFCIGK